MTIVNDYATNSLNKVHLNNQLSGKNVMPMKAHTSSNNNQFSMMRQIFQRTSKLHPENNTEKRGQNSLYQDHSQYLAKKKSRAIGKQQYGKTPLKFNSNPQNDTKNALKRMRSSGSSVPPKFRL